MKKQKIIKNLAKKISTFQSPEYEIMFFDAEQLVRIAINEYGYDAIQQISIGELIDGVEKCIPKKLINTRKITILRESL
jgi:hypothetical protein